ncbi:MAG: diacylglycerol kinase [Clostridiaceae bacterium]|nr:diacylglycerol kinase [Clostridiaceae bacterium]
MKSRNIFYSFKYAISGIIYAFRTQRNLKIHFLAAAGVLLVSPFFHFSKVELLLLSFTITLVIVCELFNTAIEIVVDMVAKKYHPLAKIAKDVAAGAVLVSAINALVVAYFLFISRME